MTDAIVSTVAIEVTETDAGAAQVSTVGVEVIEADAGDARVSTVGVEAVNVGQPAARVSTVAVEAVNIGQPAAVTTLVGVEVWRTIRDAPYPNFPVRLFCPPALTVRIEGGGLGGGQSTSGEEQFEAMTSGAHWAMEFGEVALWDREKVLTWRSFVSAADNGAMPVIVPLWDRAFGPFATTRYTGASTFGKVVWRDTNVIDAVEIQAAAAADAAQHAREVSFSYTGGLPLEGGEHFSVYGSRYGWRLYRLMRKTAADVGDVQSWEIRPPLREWLGAGTPLEFDSPRCTMRAEGDLSEIVDLLRFGRGKATFVESFSRYP